jgi:cytochrome c biogenesis protein ResB
LVNKPLNFMGWKIYQLSYSEAMGGIGISILELVRDPWLPYVYTGIFMMLAGAVWLFLKSPTSRHFRP